jgi:hypothetical protein
MSLLCNEHCVTVIPGVDVDPAIYRAYDTYLDRLDQQWDAARAEVLGRPDINNLSPQQIGSYIHSAWAARTDADKTTGLLPETLAIEENIARDGDDLGPLEAGTYIRPDATFTDGTTLKIYVDGKSGQSGLSNTRINEFIQSAGQRIQNVIVILQR